MKWGLVTLSQLSLLLRCSHRAPSSFTGALLRVKFFFLCLRFQCFGVMWFAQSTSGSGQWTRNYRLLAWSFSFWLHGKHINACIGWCNGSIAPDLIPLVGCEAGLILCWGHASGLGWGMWSCISGARCSLVTWICSILFFFLKKKSWFMCHSEVACVFNLILIHVWLTVDKYIANLCLLGRSLKNLDKKQLQRHFFWPTE